MYFFLRKYKSIRVLLINKNQWKLTIFWSFLGKLLKCRGKFSVSEEILGEKNKKCLKSSEMHRKVVFIQLLKNAYFAYLCIIIHNFNFLVFFPYSLDQYLTPLKRIRIISAIVSGPGNRTDRQTHTTHTFPKYKSGWRYKFIDDGKYGVFY